MTTRQMLVFGLGSGRCGTTSLRLFLDLQRDVSVTHELNFDGIKQPLPWQEDLSLVALRIDQLLQKTTPIKGDIGFYWLPYTEWVLSRFGDTRFVCLQREKSDTVVSYLRRTEGRNHWLEHNGTHWQMDEVWDKAFPKYDIADKCEAIAHYWDEYYTTAERLQCAYPGNFRIFPVDALNSRKGQSSILSHLGIAPADMIFTPSFRLNASGEQ